MPQGTLARLVAISDDAPHRPSELRGPTRQFLLYAALRREQRAELNADGAAPSEAARILALAQSSYRGLEALLAGKDVRLIDDARDGEWSLRDLLRHAIATELRYREQVRYSAGREEGQPLAIPADRLPCDRLNPPDPEFAPSRTGGMDEALELLRRARERSDLALADLATASLGRPSLWGESQVDVRERLHQMAVHLTEVTLQAEKMLSAADQIDGEARRIVRRIWETRGRHERASPPDLLADLDGRLEAIAGDAG